MLPQDLQRESQHFGDDHRNQAFCFKRIEADIQADFRSSHQSIYLNSTEIKLATNGIIFINSVIYITSIN